MELSQVSRTAFLTLICRAVVSEQEKAVFHDPMAVLCLERLLESVPEEERRWISKEKRVFGGFQREHAIAGMRRVKIFDEAARRFIADHPQCTVVNLGCGFDTRFWRIANENCRYMEVDLPEVVALKRDVLKDQAGYEMIGCSVLDDAWMEQVTARGNSQCLLLAEGLFSYIPRPQAMELFQRLCKRFVRSQIVLDMVPESYTRGFWKWLFGLETRYTWGLDVAWVAGIKHPDDLEVYAPGLRLLGAEKAAGGPIMSLAINEG